MKNNPLWRSFKEALFLTAAIAAGVSYVIIAIYLCTSNPWWVALFMPVSVFTVLWFNMYNHYKYQYGI